MSLFVWVYSGTCALPPLLGISSYTCFIPNTGPCSAYQWSGTNQSVIFTVVVTSASWGLGILIFLVSNIIIYLVVIKQRAAIAKTMVHKDNCPKKAAALLRVASQNTASKIRLISTSKRRLFSTAKGTEDGAEDSLSCSLPGKAGCSESSPINLLRISSPLTPAIEVVDTDVSITDVDIPRGNAPCPDGSRDDNKSHPNVSHADVSHPDVSRDDISYPHISNADGLRTDASYPDGSRADVSNPGVLRADLQHLDAHPRSNTSPSDVKHIHMESWDTPSNSVLHVDNSNSKSSCRIILHDVEEKRAQVEKNEGTTGDSNNDCNCFPKTKHVKSLLIIVIAYFITWTPFCVLLLFEIQQKTKQYSDLSLIFLWIGHISSFINPALYFYRYNRFRKEAKALWRKIVTIRVVPG